ncbi:MAG: VWA domain-containing protein [Oscillospiraceae bacterium]|nr:VWA domain-containing protein [Oscillospiraceae bacterium]
MKNNVTELVFILDRSGSMHGLESDTIGGFNSLIEKQKEVDGKCYVTTVLFADRSETVHDRAELAGIRPMTGRDYVVGGCTALLDALGDTIRHIAKIHKYARPEDVPEHTTFVIMTDGMENASRRYDSDAVKRLIEHEKEKYGWEFLYLAANIDAVETAARVGIRADRAVNYNADSRGTEIAYGAVAETVCAQRMGLPIDAGWCRRIRKDHDARGRR